MFVPREYQKNIINHIIEHKRCCVFAGMGMGKTASTLFAVSALKAIGEGDIRDPEGFRGHPTDLDVECLGVIKPENTVKHIQKMLKLYKQRKAGK